MNRGSLTRPLLNRGSLHALSWTEVVYTPSLEPRWFTRPLLNRGGLHALSWTEVVYTPSLEPRWFARPLLNRGGLHALSCVGNKTLVKRTYALIGGRYWLHKSGATQAEITLFVEPCTCSQYLHCTDEATNTETVAVHSVVTKHTHRLGSTLTTYPEVDLRYMKTINKRVGNVVLYNL